MDSGCYPVYILATEVAIILLAKGKRAGVVMNQVVKTEPLDSFYSASGEY